MSDELDAALNPHPFEKVVTKHNSVAVTLTHGEMGRGAEVDAYIKITGELVDLNTNLENINTNMATNNKNMAAINTSLEEGGKKSAELAKGANWLTAAIGGLALVQILIAIAQAVAD
jgi:hypothetical protein